MQDIYKQLADAVVAMRADEVVRLSKKILELGLPADEAIEQGLAVGMNTVGALFAAKEYFVPEVLVCARAMYGGFDILKEKVVEGKIATKGKILIGVVDGDHHDIGKNIVKLMLEASGFQMIDLGKNVKPEKFLETCKSENPSIVAMSTLMTTTMDSMAEIAKSIMTENPQMKIMVGGAPVNKDFADSIGVDFYGEDAAEAVKGAHSLMGIKIET